MKQKLINTIKDNLAVILIANSLLLGSICDRLNYQIPVRGLVDWFMILSTFSAIILLTWIYKK